MLRRYTSGAWTDVENLKRYSGGSWADCESAKRYADGTWGNGWERYSNKLVHTTENQILTASNYEINSKPDNLFAAIQVQYGSSSSGSSDTVQKCIIPMEPITCEYPITVKTIEVDGTIYGSYMLTADEGNGYLQEIYAGDRIGLGYGGDYLIAGRYTFTLNPNIRGERYAEEKTGHMSITFGGSGFIFSSKLYIPIIVYGSKYAMVGNSLIMAYINLSNLKINGEKWAFPEFYMEKH